MLKIATSPNTERATVIASTSLGGSTPQSLAAAHRFPLNDSTMRSTQMTSGIRHAGYGPWHPRPR